MRIGELAERAGLRASAIRYYEDVGLMRRARRVSGRRVYGEADAHRLRLIRIAADAGFSIADIKRIVPALESGHAGRRRWESLAQDKVSELGARIAALETMRSHLQMALRCACDGDVEVCVLEPTPRRRASR